MEFRTVVDIPKAGFAIQPCEPLLFVGSCFADSIGQRFREEAFPVVVNPFGTMYNPVSVLHTVERCAEVPRIVFLTLGTNHIYRLKATGEVVDNCEKRPQSLFQEEVLTVDECCDYLCRAVGVLQSRRPDVQVVLTVSPIRYRKYGYHESQLSKATLLLAVEKLFTLHYFPFTTYFPAYEIVLDELRDYRFYASDMLHPSPQAVEYIWERLVDACFSPAAKAYLDEWRPVKQALSHKPFNPDAPETIRFRQQTHERLEALRRKYPSLAVPSHGATAL
ncbi:MAG: GSCFA domain-containing protein [Prevotella sp.]|nr:GSCFA domain-containing protein [Prevotella sp.]